MSINKAIFAFVMFASLTLGACVASHQAGCDGCDGYGYDRDGRYYDRASNNADGYNRSARTPANTPTCTLYAVPGSVKAGESITLFWDSSNATSGSIDNNIGAVNGAAGHISGTVTETTQFNGVFYDANGRQAHCSIIVAVKMP